jgi:hypothetical protein
MLWFGLQGDMRPEEKKRTRFMTNFLHLWNYSDSKFCDNHHDHVTVQGSKGGEKRSVGAQQCPPALCQTAVDAFRLYCQHIGLAS